MNVNLLIEDTKDDIPPARPSATLVLLRDGSDDLQVLLLRRGRQLSAFAGAWAFPGGVTEKTDRSPGGSNSSQMTARHTAVRELAEETGLTVDPDVLVPLSRWTTPVVMPHRFDTWFFLAAAPRAQVRVDHSEIHDHRWISPREALQNHRAGALPLFPPTWVTLFLLGDFHRSEAALAHAAGTPPYHYAPKVVTRGDETCFLYGGDQAYARGPIDKPGPRHRLRVRGRDWQYECTRDPRARI